MIVAMLCSARYAGSLASVLLAVALHVTALADTVSSSNNEDLRVWLWKGPGNFPETLLLTMGARQKTGLVEVRRTEPLRSVDGWGELQQDETTDFAIMRTVNQRSFLIFSDDRIAEIAQR